MVWGVFKVDSGDIRTAAVDVVLVSSYCSFRVYFAPCSGVYVVGFEKVNVGWFGNIFVDHCIYVCLFDEKYKNSKWKKG